MPSMQAAGPTIYPMIFSGLGKLFDEFLSNPAAAIGRVYSNDLNPCHGPR